MGGSRRLLSPTSSASAGGDRCPSTKPAALCRRLDPRATAPSDEKRRRAAGRASLPQCAKGSDAAAPRLRAPDAWKARAARRRPLVPSAGAGRAGGPACRRSAKLAEPSTIRDRGTWPEVAPVAAPLSGWCRLVRVGGVRGHRRGTVDNQRDSGLQQSVALSPRNAWTAALGAAASPLKDERPRQAPV